MRACAALPTLLPHPEDWISRVPAVPADAPASHLQMACVAAVCGETLDAAVQGAQIQTGRRLRGGDYYVTAQTMIQSAYHLGVVLERRAANAVNLNTSWGILACDAVDRSPEGRFFRLWFVYVGVGGCAWVWSPGEAAGAETDPGWMGLGWALRRWGVRPVTVLLPTGYVHDPYAPDSTLADEEEDDAEA